jgi:cytochrome o ubiquinol oxidase subunit 2
MGKSTKIAFFVLLFLGLATVGLIYFFQGEIAVLAPEGIISEKQRNLLVDSTLLMMIVVIPTLILTFLIAWKYRASNKGATYNPNWNHSTLLECVWWGVPFIIIVILGIMTWNACHELDPFKPLDSVKKPVRVQVVALQWKWLFLYPEQNIATINFIQVPEKTPINFEVTADAPMNSFWIPKLGGQVYAMSGMKSKLHLMANRAGTYSGSSANLSGEGFAGMTFTVKVSSEEEFEKWVDDVKASSSALTEEKYKKLVMPSQYDPVSTYQLQDTHLFDQIIMKYMGPMSERMDHASKP